MKKTIILLVAVVTCFMMSACSKTISGEVVAEITSTGLDCLSGDCFLATGKITIDGIITEFSLQTPNGLFRQEFLDAHEIKIEMSSQTPPPNQLDYLGVTILNEDDNNLATDVFIAPEGWGTTITPYNITVSTQYTAR